MDNAAGIDDVMCASRKLLNIHFDAVALNTVYINKNWKKKHRSRIQIWCQEYDKN